MPLIDIKCRDCGHTWEYQRPLAEYPNVPACECGSSSTESFHPLPRARWTVDPVVVFRAPDGTYRFPGDASGIAAGDYTRQGFDRIELRGAAEVRSFEKRMNKIEYDRLARRVEIQHRIKERSDAQRAETIRHGMQQGFLIPEVDTNGHRTGKLVRVRLSERGRAMMREAERRSAARPQPSARDVGFHVDVYSNNRSNREDSRDAVGRRRRD